MFRSFLGLFIVLLLCVNLTGCRVARHIPQDRAVVSRVEIRYDGEPSTDAQLRMALLQKPYRRTFGFLPLSAWIWHPDTLSGWNRLRGRLGTAPTIYSDSLTARTDLAMERVMRQKGYLDVNVSHETRISNHKARIIYSIEPGRPRYVSSLSYVAEDPSLQDLINEDVSSRLLAPGQFLDQGLIESERGRITEMLRNRGYYDFDRSDISFLADTLAGSQEVELTCVLSGKHSLWRIRRVHFITNFDILSTANTASTNTNKGTFRELSWPGYYITYDGDRSYLRERVLMRNSSVLPGMLYSERALRNTYSAMSRLHILRYINVRVEPVSDGRGDTHQLDCFIYLTPQAPNAVQFELDGTNTAGDLGVALGMTYQNRNIFRGSEAFTTHLRGSYEALSGNVENLVNKNYQEYAAEVSLDLPQFLFPFISDDRRRKSSATSVLKLSYARQSRPEYSRNIASGGFGYKWSSAWQSAHHMLDVINLSYVYLPEQSETFKDIIENLGPMAYSSYTSHFIVGMDYKLYMGNNTLTTGRQRQTTRDLWYLRINPEIAGNLLYEACSLFGQTQFADGRYHLLGQPFEQYARFDIDWSYSHYLTDRSRLAVHLAGGVAVPFRNSDVMPFEKRYYSGGANSVRGWSVRELGPGRYTSLSAAYNYFNQCGDIRMDASFELRTRLFAGLESAVFLDGGNVWTIKEYENQKGGAFTSDFVKEIALAWGVGIRYITDFVLLRLDWGFKAHDPSYNADERWPLPHPLRSNHNTIHFAVGYPF